MVRMTAPSGSSRPLESAPGLSLTDDRNVFMLGSRRMAHEYCFTLTSTGRFNRFSAASGVDTPCPANSAAMA